MKKIADFAAYLFIVSVVLLSFVSILGVWDIFEKDVISKSFQSISLLAAVAVIILIAERFIDSRKTAALEQNYSVDGQGIAQPSTDLIPTSPGFKVIRHLTLTILILSVALLALFGILSIWEVISGSVVTKSIASISIIAFASFVVVFTCLQREDHKILRRGKNKSSSIGSIVLIIFLIWIMFSFLGSFFY
jgi:uncharacterized membrane protein